jgi:Uma2 family endonuclease
MTQAKPRFRTIEEYLDYADGTDIRYELVRGELVEMPNESTLNTQIAVFLILTFAALGIPPTRIGIKQMIAVSSSEVTARDPDLIVHSEDSIAAIEGKTRALISVDLPAPLLVIEIVSPGNPETENYDRDYVEKPIEYAARGIPEFWRVDPSRAVVAVLSLSQGSYQVREFCGSSAIVSPAFPTLQITAEKILNAG